MRIAAGSLQVDRKKIIYKCQFCEQGFADPFSRRRHLWRKGSGCAMAAKKLLKETLIAAGITQRVQEGIVPKKAGTGKR